LELHHEIKKIKEEKWFDDDIEIFKRVFREKTILFQIEKCGSTAKFSIF
jgi:hypothetical protein